MAMAVYSGASGPLFAGLLHSSRSNDNSCLKLKQLSTSVAGPSKIALKICRNVNQKRMNGMSRVTMTTAAEIPLDEEMDRVSLMKYVKQRLPGGIAAQELIGTGYKKRAIARVVLLEGTGKVFINGRTAQDYLQGNPLWLQYLRIPLVTLGFENTYDVFVKAHGGGLASQAQASLLGIARALCKANPDNRPALKSRGLLTRDTRKVERKKAGFKKARKRPQYSKR